MGDTYQKVQAQADVVLKNFLEIFRAQNRPIVFEIFVQRHQNDINFVFFFKI